MISVSEHRCQHAIDNIKKQIPIGFSYAQFEKRFKELTGKKCYFEFVEHTEMFIQFDDDRDYMMFLLRWS